VAAAWTAGLACAQSEAVAWPVVGILSLFLLLIGLFRSPFRWPAVWAILGIALGSVTLIRQAQIVQVGEDWQDQPLAITATLVAIEHSSLSLKLRLADVRADVGAGAPTNPLAGLIDVYLWKQKQLEIPALIPGQRLAASVKLHTPHQRQNPGGFDYLGMLKRQHVVLTGSVQSGPEILPQTVPWLETMRQNIRNNLPDKKDGGGILSAILLAERDQISTPVLDAFSASGTAHLLAISGMHLGMVAGWCYLLSWWLLTRRARWIVHIPVRRISLLAGIVGATAYATLAGWPLPTQRAGMMLLAVAVAWWWRESYDPMHTLLLALMIITLLQPTAVLSVSLWLSFAAAAALLLFMQADAHQQQKDPSFWASVQRLLKGLLAVTVIAGLATLPIITDTFGRIPVWSIPANLLLVLLYSAWVLPMALLGEIFSLLAWPDAASLLLQGAAVGVRLGNDWIEMFYHFPAGNLWIADIPLWLGLAYAAALMVAAWLWQHQRRRIASLLMAAGLGMFLLLSIPERPPSDSQFIAWDVGQGAASTLILADGKVMVIDAPGSYGSRFNGGTTIADGLRAMGLTHVDVIMISHAQSDHAGGLLRLLEQQNHVGELWLADVPANRDYPAFRLAIKRLQQRGGSVRWLSQGDFQTFGEAKIHIL